MAELNIETKSELEGILKQIAVLFKKGDIRDKFFCDSHVDNLLNGYITMTEQEKRNYIEFYKREKK